MTIANFEHKPLFGTASGVITTTSVGDEIVSVVVDGCFTAKQSAKSVVIGRLENYSNGRYMFPVSAWRSTRDRDTVMQIDPDGKILLLNVTAGTEYTFHQPIPFTW